MPTQTPPWIIALAALTSLCACTTAMTTIQPAQTLAPRAMHVSVGLDVNVPVTRVVEALDAAADIAENYAANPGYVPPEDEQRRYLDALIGLALNAPGVMNDFMFRYGFGDRIDGGLRYTGTAVHVDAKYRFLERNGWHGSASLGYTHHLFKGLIFDALEYIHVDDFSRRDFSMPIIFGRRLADYGYLWLGPKYVFSRVGIDSTLQNVDDSLALRAPIHHFGGFVGVALGYRVLYVYAEVTALQMFAEPVILREATDIGGLVIQPAFGVMGRF